GRSRRPRVGNPDLQSRRRRCQVAVLARAVSCDLHRGLRADLIIVPCRGKPRDAPDHLRGGAARLLCDFRYLWYRSLRARGHHLYRQDRRGTAQIADRRPYHRDGGNRQRLPDTPGQFAIEDRGWRRRVIIDKDGAASTVVWNPWTEKAAAMVDLGDPAWRGMVCVETGNIADNEVRLAADGEHRMSTTISIAAGP